MHLLGISGSLRASSSNTNVVLAAARLVPDGCTLERYDVLAGLPHFDPDLDTEHPPEPVRAMRERVGACDGLVVCSPEYARGVPGTMKNALDWLVSSDVFSEKPVMLVNASQRATSADEQLRLIVRTMSARLIEEACITLPLLGRENDCAAIVADEVLSAALRNALGRFVAAIAAPIARGGSSAPR